MVDVATFTRRFEALVRGGVGPGLPRRVQNRHILLKAVALGLEQNRVYSESALGEALDAWLDSAGPQVDIDRVSLRRALVDHGYVSRDSAGHSYRVESPGTVAFDPEVNALDIRRILRDISNPPE